MSLGTPSVSSDMDSVDDSGDDSKPPSHNEIHEALFAFASAGDVKGLQILLEGEKQQLTQALVRRDCCMFCVCVLYIKFKSCKWCVNQQGRDAKAGEGVVLGALMCDLLRPFLSDPLEDFDELIDRKVKVL